MRVLPIWRGRLRLTTRARLPASRGAATERKRRASSRYWARPALRVGPNFPLQRTPELDSAPSEARAGAVERSVQCLRAAGDNGKRRTWRSKEDRLRSRSLAGSSEG